MPVCHLFYNFCLHFDSIDVSNIFCLMLFLPNCNENEDETKRTQRIDQLNKWKLSIASVAM